MKKLIQFELRKLCAARLTQAAFLTLLLLSALLGFSTYQNMYAFDGNSREGTGRAAVEIDQSIAENYGGLLTDEKVRRMMEAFQPTQDLHGMHAAYLYQNALQSALFCNFSDSNGNWNGLSVSDVFGTEEIQIGYTYGWLKTSQNMVKLLILSSFAAAMITAPIFSGEYEGVDQIILTSRYGKTKCSTAKVIAGSFTALFLTTVVSAVNLIYAFVLYGSSGLGCSILFAPADFSEAYIPFNLTCGTLLQYQILLAFTGTLGITGITFALSAVCKNPMLSLAASAAVYFFPVMLPVPETSPLFKFLTLLPIYHAQFVSLMSIGQCSGSVLYAQLAVPAALLLMGAGIFISRRVFAKHQVS